MRPFEGFDWGAMALLSKAPQWGKDDYEGLSRRLEQGLMIPATSLAAAVAEPLSQRLGRTLAVDARIGASVTALEAVEGREEAAYRDYTLVTFDVVARSGPAAWLRIRLGHDTVGYACGADLGDQGFRSWQLLVEEQRSVTDLLAHHPTLSVIGFADEAVPPPPPPRRPTPFALPPVPPSPALVGPVSASEVRIGWHDPLPPTSTLPRFVPFCVERLVEFAPVLTLWEGLG